MKKNTQYQRWVLLLICFYLLGASVKKYGHYEFEQINKKKLVVVGEYHDGRKKYLSETAYNAFLNMQKAAKKEDISFVILSGFRTVKYQKWLFKRAVKKYGSPKKAARHVAPPGHSEHHTGTAIDIGDPENPKTHLSETFEKTKSFIWLKKHAKDYGFTLSFPRDNPAGISYEPWHWRFRKRNKK